jgi:hypothetical protein
MSIKWENGSNSKPSERRKGGAPKGNQNAKGNKGGGRNTSYKPEYAHQAQRLCAVAGFTDKKLAEFFGVSEMTINRWKLKHVEFLLAMKAGKSVFDDLVERAVVQGITGYYVEEVEEVHANGHFRKMRSWVPGNPMLGLRWLALRRPEEFRATGGH